MSDVTVPTSQRAPETPSTSPARWVRENLFSSVSNAIQTVFFSLVLLGLLRWVLGQIFSEEANWTSVATNMRLLFTYNYPTEQFVRIWFAAGALFLAVGASFAAWNLNPAVTVRKIGVAVLVCGVLWFFPFGDYGFADGAPTAESGTIDSSTSLPVTVMFLIMIATYVAGRALARRIDLGWLRRTMIGWWVIGPAFIVFLVLRDPEFDWGYVLAVDVPMGAAFAVGGAVLLYALSKPSRSDLARVIGALLVALALFHWVAAFFGWYPMLQKARFSFALIAVAALLAPTFAGERSARLRFAGGWFGFMVLFHWLLTGINTPSTLDIAAPPFLGGFVLTVSIAYYVMLASFPLGVLLSLARTSKMPIFRVLSTTYIEVVRGVPLITVLFFFSIMLPLFLPGGMGISDLAAVFAGYTVFSAAYMAENIRGGLQSVRRGQYEAADALGLTTVQRTAFIVLPQALRVSIPNLVGQAIATFKETSLIAIVGGFDILRIANSTIPNQPDFLGQKRPALFFISVVYFIVAYSMSRASRNLEERLEAGQAR
ncbi:MAG: amino acid ABC transporter permease [Actinobacteria bacterium]|nr:amino acid ABC transporter permease [Actinomycetota bacterium]